MDLFIRSDRALHSPLPGGERSHRGAMRVRGLERGLLFFFAAVMAFPHAAFAADVRVMISAGFYRVYAELGPAFERASGHHLITTRGPSIGDSPEVDPDAAGARRSRRCRDPRRRRGRQARERGLVRADSKVTLARSLIGMVVRAGAPKPDIGSVEAFKQRAAGREVDRLLGLRQRHLFVDAAVREARHCRPGVPKNRRFAGRRPASRSPPWWRAARPRSASSRSAS